MELRTFSVVFFVSIITMLLISRPIAGKFMGPGLGEGLSCPEPSCAPPPKGACIQPQYTYVNGIKCPDCYLVVDCPKDLPCLTCCGPPPCCSDCGIVLK